jgi:sulfonate transport system permease protein
MIQISTLAQRLRSYLCDRWISIATLVVMAIAWEIAAHLSPTGVQQTSLVPTWASILGHSFKGMSDYWKLNILAPVPSTGGEQTYLGAILALIYHSSLTLFRLLLGLTLGAIGGTGLGLLLSWSPIVRRLSAAPLHVLRMCPLLAVVPLFQFWFGTSNQGAILFIAYGVGVIYLVGTINAISNVPNRYVEYALTLGASRLRIYTSIVLPAILPELFSSIFVTLGLAWSAVIGAEYVGVDSGIGRMIIWAEFFSDTGRIALVTIFIIFYAAISFWVSKWIASRVLRWMP